MVSRAIAFLFGLLLATAAAAQPVGPPQISCNKTFQVSQGAVALTQIVAGVAGQSISICGWTLNAGAAAATAQLQTGTGSNCGTGTAVVTPAYSLAINGVLTDHISLAYTSLPTGNALCLVTTGTGPMQVMIYYGQF